MSRPADRRGFLRGLASLPLIGGGVALIGQPTAAAVPVTNELIGRYLSWLAHEHQAVWRDFVYRDCLSRTEVPPEWPGLTVAQWAREVRDEAVLQAWVPDEPDIEACVASAPVSTRAAVILSAAGVPIGSAP